MSFKTSLSVTHTFYMRMIQNYFTTKIFYLMTDFNWLGAFLLKFRDTYCISNWTLFRHTFPKCPSIKLSPHRNFILLKNFHMTADGLIGSLSTTSGGNMDSRLKPQQYICIFYVSFSIRFFNLCFV